MKEGKSRRSHKFFIFELKVIPMLIAGVYLLNTVLSYMEIDAPILSLIGGVSVLPVLFLYRASYSLGFCEYHRMFLHYVVISDIIAYYDMYVGIPVSDRTLFSINMVLAGLCLFVVLYLRFYGCKSKETDSKDSQGDSQQD